MEDFTGIAFRFLCLPMATKYARELVSSNLNPKKRTKKQSYACGESDVLQVLDSEDESK